MYFPLNIAAAIAVLSPFVSAIHIPRSDLNERGEVAACRAALIALRASSFCSSFVPIKDVTSTAVQTGPGSTVQVTATAACTNGKRKRQPVVNRAAPSTTRAVLSTTSTTSSAARVALSTTPAASSTTPKTSSTSSSSRGATTSSAKCIIRGLPPQVALFACDIVREACMSFVKPKTITVSSVQPGITDTKTVTETPTCLPPAKSSTTASTTTTSAAGPVCVKFSGVTTKYCKNTSCVGVYTCEFKTREECFSPCATDKILSCEFDISSGSCVIQDFPCCR